MGPENLGSTKRAAQTCSLAPEGKSVQTYPPSRTAADEERGRTAPNHQADGPLSPKDAALHMTDVALLAWPPKRHPSSISAYRMGLLRLRRRRPAWLRFDRTGAADRPTGGRDVMRSAAAGPRVAPARGRPHIVDSRKRVFF